MLQGKIVLKIPFYYRTRDEYNEVQTYMDKLNAEKQSMPQLDNKILLHMHTRYQSKNKDDRWSWDSKIPGSRPGKKRYIGVMAGNCHLMKTCDVRPEEFLRELVREVVPKIAGVSKYDGCKTTHPITIKTHQEFRTITSVFNKRYGHGNWRIQGPKKLQNILKQIEPRDDNPQILYIGDYERDYFLKKYPNGIPVTLIIKEPNANIPKQLFKVVLKG